MKAKRRFRLWLSRRMTKRHGGNGLLHLATSNRIIETQCRRYDLDARLKALLEHMENRWFGPWKGLLLGAFQDERVEAEFLARV